MIFNVVFISVPLHDCPKDLSCGAEVTNIRREVPEECVLKIFYPGDMSLHDRLYRIITFEEYPGSWYFFQQFSCDWISGWFLAIGIFCACSSSNPTIRGDLNFIDPPKVLNDLSGSCCLYRARQAPFVSRLLLSIE